MIRFCEKKNLNFFLFRRFALSKVTFLLLKLIYQIFSNQVDHSILSLENGRKIREVKHLVDKSRYSYIGCIFALLGCCSFAIINRGAFDQAGKNKYKYLKSRFKTSSLVIKQNKTATSCKMIVYLLI